MPTVAGAAMTAPPGSAQRQGDANRVKFSALPACLLALLAALIGLRRVTLFFLMAGLLFLHFECVLGAYRIPWGLAFGFHLSTGSRAHSNSCRPREQACSALTRLANRATAVRVGIAAGQILRVSKCQRFSTEESGMFLCRQAGHGQD